MDEVPQVIQFKTTEKVANYLDQLVDQGIYGLDLADVVERIVCEDIQRKLRQGVIISEE